MADHLAAGIVHLAVDPADVESLMAIPERLLSGQASTRSH